MKHLILSIVVLLSSVVAVADPGLTAVQKDRCLMLETMGKRMERQIASILMESPDPACAGSHYQ